MDSITVKQTSYIREHSFKQSVRKMGALYLFAYFIMPPYFGIQIAGFDLTILRIMMLVMCIYLLDDQSRVKIFWQLIIKNPHSKYIGLFIGVTLYTAAFRVNINTLLQTLLEFLCLYILVYLIRDIFGIKGFIKIILIFAYILGFLGLIEYGMGYTPFSYLETIPGLYKGAYVRSGSYRIMGPCGHALGYGLLLVTIVPIACIDLKRNVVNILQNPFLLILISANIFLTGSRSTLVVLALELVLLMLLSSKENAKRTFLFILGVLVAVAIFVVVFKNTSLAQYIMRQVTSVIDEIFGTEYALLYGAEKIRLDESSAYRTVLPKVFTLDWLNPLIGQGTNYAMSVEIDGIYVKSIDNFYVATYIRYAYPGLITFVMIIGSIILRMWNLGIKYKSGIMRCLLVGCICYFVNLWWLDSLMTLKYVYVLFAIYFVVIDPSYVETTKTKIASRYIK